VPLDASLAAFFGLCLHQRTELRQDAGCMTATLAAVRDKKLQLQCIDKNSSNTNSCLDVCYYRISVLTNMIFVRVRVALRILFVLQCVSDFSFERFLSNLTPCSSSPLLSCYFYMCTCACDMNQGGGVQRGLGLCRGSMGAESGVCPGRRGPHHRAAHGKLLRLIRYQQERRSDHSTVVHEEFYLCLSFFCMKHSVMVFRAQNSIPLFHLSQGAPSQTLFSFSTYSHVLSRLIPQGARD